MDGIHDLGGMDGFGPVERDDNEPLFHAQWEARVFALADILGGQGQIPNGDAFRHSIERMDPSAYLTQGYYGRWLAGLEGLLDDLQLVSREELRHTLRGLDATAKFVSVQGLNPPWGGDSSSAGSTDGGDCRRTLGSNPKFEVGQAVRTYKHASTGHTRLPRYARDKVGVIHKINGGWVYPDSNAHGMGEDPQHLYSVGFSGAEIWGAQGDPNLTLYLDLYEPYLQEI